MTFVAVFIALVFLYSLVSRRLETTVFTGPIIFTTAGIFSFLILPAPHHREPWAAALDRMDRRPETAGLSGSGVRVGTRA